VIISLGFFLSLRARVRMRNFVFMRVDWNKYDQKEAVAIARKFSKDVLQDMAINIQKMGLVDKKKLLTSLKDSVRKTGIEVDRIQFAYEFYGRFHENGASNVFGKNVTLKPTPWRTPAIEKNKGELDSNFNEFYAKLILDELEISSAKMEM
jgi:hypothetical protein